MIAQSIQKLAFYPRTRVKKYSAGEAITVSNQPARTQKLTPKNSPQLSDKEAYCCDQATD